MKKLILLLIMCALVSTGCKGIINLDEFTNNISAKPTQAVEENNVQQVYSGETLDIEVFGHKLSIEKYSGSPYTELNGNKPFFKDDEIISEYYESYSGLDDLGRCQVAVACISRDTMPLPYEKREDIGSVKPAGWQTAKYPELINGLYLYNRCHLIGWQLSAENANPLNLTTGTRYLNVDGMLPFENKVDDYVEKTDHHVMYRVTPIFVDDELVCRGILMEAQSVEDNGCIFCVYCYNVQPGIEINYKDGTSRVADTASDITQGVVEKEEIKEYVINNRTKKIHRPSCSSVADIESSNIQGYKGKISELLEDGYSACKKCNPD